MIFFKLTSGPGAHNLCVNGLYVSLTQILSCLVYFYWLQVLSKRREVMHLSIFSPRGGGGGDTLGIRQQNNPNPWGLDRTPKDMGWVIRYFSRSSKLNQITNLMALHPRDFGHKVFANGWGISQQFQNCLIPPGNPAPPPPPPPHTHTHTLLG